MKITIKEIVEFFKEPLNVSVVCAFLLCGVSVWISVSEALLWAAIACLLIANRHRLIYAKSMRLFAEAWEKQATDILANNHRCVITLERYEAEVDYLKGKISKEAYEERVQKAEDKLAELNKQ